MSIKDSVCCTGCGVCASICPKKCIEIKLNNDGFYRPVIETDKCINCNICEQYCNEFMNNNFHKPIDTVSAIVKDGNLLKTVSSGGVCYALAKKAVEDGVKVCGVVYDYDLHIAKHIIIDNLKDLEQTKGSKYFQSYTVDGFNEIFNGEQYMVFGTPCQIAAISKVAEAKKVRNKLILVDFFCHGTPSMLVWQKYLEEHQREKIQKIDFRSKEFSWHKFSLKFSYDDGSSYSDYEKNMFYRMFFNNLCLNDSCYNCKYKATKSLADIRTGDYWGDKYKDNTTGVSCCVVYTECGKKYLEGIKDVCFFEKEDINDMLKAQMSKSPQVDKKLRSKLLNALKSNKKLADIERTTLLPYRVRGKIKSLLRR